jgi:signal transduction histidine kinase
MGAGLDEHRLRRLLEAGRTLTAELELDRVLERLLEAGCEITGARYAAIGVLDPGRRALERFVTRGVSEEIHRAIGELPLGRGVLGALIANPQPLRLRDIGEDPRSFGFPTGHPPMKNFLGVPVLIRGEAWGNLYLTEKAEGEFADADEEAVVQLAEWAGIAVENARLYGQAHRRGVELEHAVERLEAAVAIARAVAGELDLRRIVELIVKRARALVEAEAVVALLRDGDEALVAAVAGRSDLAAVGRRMGAGTLDSLTAAGEALVAAGQHLGVPGARSGLIVPLTFRGRPLGALAAFDHMGESGPDFDIGHESLLAGFAASAASAVGTAQIVESERVRRFVEGAEQERARWGRELHDETLQGLGALRVVLSSARRTHDLDRLEQAADDAIGQLDTDIDALRGLIAELRPPTLDQLGLEPALRSLADRVATVHGLDVDARLSLGGDGLPAALEDTVYRVAQEGLTNVAKHARAERVRLEVRRDDDEIVVEVDDDGVGFDPAAPSPGFGLVGMRERVDLAGGHLELRGDAGTSVRAVLPLRPPLRLSIS